MPDEMINRNDYIVSLNNKKMKVEIWSDVMCPFCYIGKRRFERALEQFKHKDKVEVVWKSFQLDPGIKAEGNKNLNEYLAERKGWSVDQARQANAHVTDMAVAEGLPFNLDKAIVANSFDAHRFVHLAAQHGLGDAAEEKLFQSYFTEGKNIADHDTLVQLGTDIGMNKDEMQNMLAGQTYTSAVHHDIHEAAELGVRGVPFYVLNRTYAVSGAQSDDTFLGALERSFAEWEKNNRSAALNTANGEVCTPDGNCN
jgi:predicted DsbA family dithiol-disulfide isomerase